MTDQREIMERCAKIAREETLRRWKGCLMPGISNAEAVKFLSAPVGTDS